MELFFKLSVKLWIVNRIELSVESGQDIICGIVSKIIYTIVASVVYPNVAAIPPELLIKGRSNCILMIEFDNCITIYFQALELPLSKATRPWTTTSANYSMNILQIPVIFLIPIMIIPDSLPSPPILWFHYPLSIILYPLSCPLSSNTNARNRSKMCQFLASTSKWHSVVHSWAKQITLSFGFGPSPWLRQLL